MTIGISPLSCAIVAPRNPQQKHPFVLDETLPRVRDPQEVMNEKMRERILESAKNKPDEERTFLDYLILAQEKIEEMKNRSVKYLA